MDMASRIISVKLGQCSIRTERQAYMYNVYLVGLSVAVPICWTNHYTKSGTLVKKTRPHWVDVS